MGLITGNSPVVYWISAALVIVIIMIVLGLGILLPTNLRVHFELRKNESDISRIQKLMKRYVKVVAGTSGITVYYNLYYGRICYRILTSSIKNIDTSN